MMNKFKYKYKDKIVGKTNQIKLIDFDIDKINEILTSPIKSNIFEGQKNLFFSFYKIELDKSAKDKYQKMHKDIKKYISSIYENFGINIDLGNIIYDIIYSGGQGKEGYVLFVSPMKPVYNISALIKELNSSNETQLKKIIISLMFKIKILNNIKDYSDVYPNSLMNSMYFGVQIEPREKTFITCYELKFNIHSKDTLYFDLALKSFSGDNESNIQSSSTEELNLFFKNFKIDQKSKFNNTEVNISQIDARTYKFSRVFYACNEKYKDTKNYYQNIIHNYIIELFNDLEIYTEPVTFNPDYVFNNYYQHLIPEYKTEIHFSSNLIFNEKDLELKDFIMDKIQEVFPESYISTNNEYKNLSKDVNHIFVTQILDGDFIFFEQKDDDKLLKFSNTISAYHGKEQEEFFDEYTKVKMSIYDDHLNKRTPNITQGLAIDIIELRKKFEQVKNDKIQKEINKLLISETEETEKKSKRKPKLKSDEYLNTFKNKLLKIKSEIHIKRNVFCNKKIDFINDININDGFSIVYVYVVDKIKKMVLLNAEINENELIIKNFEIKPFESINEIPEMNKYKNNKKLKFEYRYKHNQFFIFNKGFLLEIVDAIDIPYIIGNNDPELDIVDYYKKHGELTRSAKHDKILLPFYASLTNKSDGLIIDNANFNQKLIKYTKTYIEKKHDNVLVFTSPNTNPDKTISKQVKPLELHLYKLNECEEYDKIVDIDNSLVKLYLNFITFDIIKNNSGGKKTLLQKIAEIYIKN